VTKSRRLRAILGRPGPGPRVGAHDALSAKLIEAAGVDTFEDHHRAWAAIKS
jgi:2-methylisocitrate lyase-like PEP mutase family enzyme